MSAGWLGSLQHKPIPSLFPVPSLHPSDRRWADGLLRHQSNLQRERVHYFRTTVQLQPRGSVTFPTESRGYVSDTWRRAHVLRNPMESRSIQHAVCRHPLRLFPLIGAAGANMAATYYLPICTGCVSKLTFAPVYAVGSSVGTHFCPLQDLKRKRGAEKKGK